MSGEQVALLPVLRCTHTHTLSVSRDVWPTLFVNSDLLTLAYCTFYVNQRSQPMHVNQAYKNKEYKLPFLITSRESDVSHNDM